jgi:hypothetical protein
MGMEIQHYRGKKRGYFPLIKWKVDCPVMFFLIHRLTHDMIESRNSSYVNVQKEHYAP